MMKTTFGRQMDKRAQWMGEYERLLVAVRPELQGKIDWETAAFLFHGGKTPQEAVNQVTSHN